MTINVGINGFGRIGKCCLLQMINNAEINIKCINAPNLNINDIEDYLKYDSIHKNYDNRFEFNIISEREFSINHHKIILISERNPKNIPWRVYKCNFVIEATGAFLTKEKCAQHDVDHVILTSPAKDNMNTYVYGVNHTSYNGEKIISASSCTTNSLAPILHIISENYTLNNAIFTTIHACTASQNVVDIVDQKARTSRSIFNNIIPHSTGASSSISSVLPKLNGLIFGTSVRVPISNCSLLDLNIDVQENISITDFFEVVKQNKYYKQIYDISNKKLVSSDFITTTTPSIIDANSSMNIGNGKFKLMVWYDNEWSYSTQIIRMMKHMYDHNQHKYILNTSISLNHFIENMSFYNKRVICRFDYNVPINNDLIVDDFRIYSTIKTIKYILQQKPKYIVLVSHLGRPTQYDESKSLKILIPLLKKYLDHDITFLDKGISLDTLYQLNIRYESTQIYLLENIRFHKEEIDYETMTDDEISHNKIINTYKQFGNIYICDAFGCMHRKHMSIHAISRFTEFGYGYLVKREVENIINILDQNKNKLVIVGGNKIKDKLPFIDLIKTIPNTSLFIGGKIATEYVIHNDDDNIFIMNDGFGGSDINTNPTYIEDINNTNLNIYDIGSHSLDQLYELIEKNEIIFWNGSLGVIENDNYVKGSICLINKLLQQINKTIIIGGGDTSSLIKKDGSIYVSTGGGALLELLENASKTQNYLIGLDIFKFF
jgi:glyceraldehyde 3-phosphate dehydrogenase